MARTLSNLHVTFLSLVDKGANQKTIVWKSAEQPDAPTIRRIIDVAKVDEDKHLVYGVVYEPCTEDSHGDMATATEIEKAAHLFLKEQRTTQVDKQHDLVADEGYVAESWIIRAADPILPDAAIGAWAVAIKVENDETWALVKSGDITGISLYGYAQVEDEPLTDSSEEPTAKVKQATKASSEESLVRRLLKRFRPQRTAVSKDFNSQQDASALWHAVDNLHYANRDALYEASPKEALRTNIAQFLEYLDSLEEIMKTDSPTGTPSEPTLEARLAALEKQLAEKESAEPETEAEAQPDHDELLARIEALEKAATPNEPSGDDEDPTVALLERIEALEKRSGGRTSEQSQTDPEPVKKSYKGIRFF